jgi:hypothetical protein
MSHCNVGHSHKNQRNYYNKGRVPKYIGYHFHDVFDVSDGLLIGITNLTFNPSYNSFHVKMIFLPLVLDNWKFWQIFENGEHIVELLMKQSTEEEEFSEDQRSEYLNHGSDLSTEVPILL